MWRSLCGPGGLFAGRRTEEGTKQKVDLQAREQFHFLHFCFVSSVRVLSVVHNRFLNYNHIILYYTYFDRNT